jgi:hypothetical protein
VIFLLAITIACLAQAQQPPGQINVQPAHISTDGSIKHDYDIVYVRSPRWIVIKGEKQPARWAEFGHPFAVNPGSDLMLLHPDGSEELLVSGGEGAIQDPYVSFDGEWVFYTKFHVATDDVNPFGADIYKVHVKTRKVVQLTHQDFTTNKEGVKLPYGVYNMHPCPVPGGRVAFVSNRNGFLPPPKSYPPVALQLHIMDEDGSNIETIGHLNLGGALHPVILKDGRIIFSSLENMGLRRGILWGLWSIWQDGTVWSPVVSGFFQASGAHFQTQLSDERIIWEMYYNQNQKGFGTLFALPPQPPPGHTAFGPADLKDPRNPVFRSITGQGFQLPFTPYGMALLTPWATGDDDPALPSIAGVPTSPRIGKVTHPSGAPDNHLLLVWSLGPIGGSGGSAKALQPQPIDSGIYLLKNGQAISAPGEMRLIKNDPNYNEQWPRALVPYARIYGVAAPAVLRHKNNGSASPHLPEGTPFGLVGTSSLYKRESAPLGAVPADGVTAVTKDWSTAGQWHWYNQGSDAGRYDNSEIQGIRILAFEPNAARSTRAHPVKHWYYPIYNSHAMERLRILGELPVRAGKGTALDPDGNPDTSFLAKIPADVAFTFQMIDKNGMALTMAQTWHQVRPGEIRNNCGGCHAHSQQPTPFEKTAAARPDYALFDLTQKTPLLTSQAKDASGQQWDTAQEVGLRFEKAPKDVEYWKDIRPILDHSCTACHTKQWSQPAGGLVLDDDATTIDGLPGTYFRLAAENQQGKFNPRLPQRVTGPDQNGVFMIRGPFHNDMASRYIWKLQSRRSLLAWKIYGKRLDGWSNEDIPSEVLAPQDPRRKAIRGDQAPDQPLYIGDVDYTGSIMPPPTAIAGTYQGPDGKPIKVTPLTDEDRRTIVRWIDLGCPIDLALSDRSNATKIGHDTGMSDDQRPTLTLTYPEPGVNPPLSRILVGMYDYNAGLDMTSFQVIADVAVDGIPAGRNLASKFQALPDYRWEWRLASPITALARGKLIVSVKDRQGNLSRIERTFSVNARTNAGVQ